MIQIWFKNQNNFHLPFSAFLTILTTIFDIFFSNQNTKSKLWRETHQLIQILKTPILLLHRKNKEQVTTTTKIIIKIYHNMFQMIKKCYVSSLNSISFLKNFFEQLDILKSNLSFQNQIWFLKNKFNILYANIFLTQ